MMSASTEAVQDFSLVVETEGAATLFPPPPSWEETTYTVNEITVHHHSPISEAAPKAHLPPILTFHDVGQNAATCFATFFNHAIRTGSIPELTSAASHYHLTAPGHLPDAPALPAATSLAIADVAHTVERVLDRFQLSRVIAIGLGIGSAILLRAAAARPKAFAGLVLISPVLRATSVVERASISVDGVLVKNLGLGLSRRVKDRILARWLSDETREENHVLVSSLEDALNRLNAANLVRFLAADTWREDALPYIRSVRAKVLLLSGKESPLREDTAEAFASFNPASTSWLDVPDAGSLVHDEAPDAVAQSVSLFLQGFPTMD